ncbi:MAG: NifU family protein [Chloroflexota bacterium]|nr:NifU family protein [Chloroflexota bacterium]
MPVDPAIQEQIGRIESLVQAIDGWTDPAARAGAAELLQATLTFHGAGLERMLDLAWESGPAGQALIDQLAGDPLVSRLLLLHDLHPLDLAARVTQALEKVRPYLASHGGNVELLSIEGSTVQLRLQGSCHGCPSSAMTLKLAIEEALQEYAPDMTDLVVEGVVEAPPPPINGFVPLTMVGGPKQKRPPAPSAGWENVAGGDLRADGVHPRDIAGQRVLFCRAAGQLYAYRPTCPACGQALDTARLTGGILTCPACAGTYDLMRAGRGLDRPELHLEPVPLLVEQGQIKVALAVLAG